MRLPPRRGERVPAASAAAALAWPRGHDGGFIMRRRRRTNGGIVAGATVGAVLMLLLGRVASAQPVAFDWRNNGGVNYVSGVRNQGNCGSVYIFAPVAMVESRQMIAAGRLGRPVTELDYSEQYLLACGTGAHGAFGCSGGYPNEVLVYLRDVGAPRERCYLSRGADATCPTSCPDSADPLRLFTPVASVSVSAYPGDATLRQLIYDQGPVAVTLDLYDDFTPYDGGIYSHPSGGVVQGSTLVTVVGWGTEAGTEYWIAKNSWGTWWGEDGYIRIARASRGGCNFAAFVYACSVDVPAVTAVEEPALPAGLLVQAHPNPFNPWTTVHFEVPAAGRVRLEVLDARGRLVRVLLDTDLPAGSHEAAWDGRDTAGRALASGAYFVRLEAGTELQTARLSLVR